MFYTKKETKKKIFLQKLKDNLFSEGQSYFFLVVDRCNNDLTVGCNLFFVVLLYAFLV